jgi:hypothetical protein
LRKKPQSGRDFHGLENECPPAKIIGGALE